MRLAAILLAGAAATALASAAGPTSAADPIGKGLVIADSDTHARPDYLRRLAAGLERPGVGMVTTLYTGLPAFNALPNRLGTMQITHGFLPGALLGRALGRRDCLGATMCIRRETLLRIGGLEALKDHLADDQVLGRRVRAARAAVHLPVRRDRLHSERSEGPGTARGSRIQPGRTPETGRG